MNVLFQKESHTIGEFVSAVWRIENEADAKRFAEDYVDWLSNQECKNNYSADEVMRANIGWCFGEGMADDKIAMWRQACNASHPWFGAMATKPTPDQCLAIGKALATKI